MPGPRRRDGDLNGSAPDRAPVALLLIDVINEFAFPEAPALLRHARPMARALRRLKQRAHAASLTTPQCVLFTAPTRGRPASSCFVGTDASGS